MAILGKSNSQIEVRLEKLPINEQDPTYFDEYAPLDERENLRNTITRYIVPEEQAYAIKIIVKKGFVVGKYDGGFGVMVHDGATGTELFDRQLTSGIEEYNSDDDTIYHVASVDSAVVDGVLKQNVQFAFHQLYPDEELSGEANLIGCDAGGIGGIKVTIIRSSEPKLEPKPDALLEKEMAIYQAQMSGSDSLSKVLKIDQKLFNKRGITHGAGLMGGETGGTLGKPHDHISLSNHVERRYYHFICRTADYLEEARIAKTPIPQECRPWSYFKEHERAAIFKDLQTYDKEHTLKQKIAEAGPDADVKVMKRELFETGEIINRWRGWGQTYKRERESLFKELQCRRNFFENGVYPPDEKLPGNSTDTVLSPDVPKPEDNQADGDKPEPPSTITIKRESESNVASNEKTSLPVQATIKTEAKTDAANGDSGIATIKNEPEDGPPRTQTAPAKQVVIILDDSDDDTSLSKKNAPPKNITIKTETTAKHEIDEPQNSIQEVPKKRGGDNNERPAKRSRIEPDIALPSIEPDPELLRLKEEDELMEEELLAAQRVALLIRARNERKAKIAALEARSSATPTPRKLGNS